MGWKNSENCTFRFHYYIQKDFLFKQLVYLALQFLRREVAGDDGPLPINQEMLADVVDGPIADDGAAPIFVVGNQVPFDAVVALIIPVLIPFNLLKGLLNSVITLIVYKSISNIITPKKDQKKGR